jgi:hypothetical protein
MLLRSVVLLSLLVLANAELNSKVDVEFGADSDVLITIDGIDIDDGVFPRELHAVSTQKLSSLLTASSNTTNSTRLGGASCPRKEYPTPADLYSDASFLQTMEKAEPTSSKWLTDMECKIKSLMAAAGPSPLAERSEMRVIWSSPIFIMNLESFGVNVPYFNSRLAQQIMEVYSAFVKQRSVERQQGELEDVISADRINDDFYYFQTEEDAWPDRVSSSNEFEELIKIMQTGVDLFLDEIPKSKEWIAARDREDPLVWATVHSHGIHHPQQFHADSLMSALFYVHMPPGGAPIVFHDPRGPYPPFDNTFTIEPKHGDMIFFPSWLRHEVPGTVGADSRISLSFNFPGEWHATTQSDHYYAMQHKL